MSQIYSLVCHEIRGKIWIGQGWGEMTTLYSGESETMEGLKEFLNASKGRPIFFVCDDELPDDMDEVFDYKDYEQISEKREA